MTVRGYREDDREACRALWVELTDRHRRRNAEAIRFFHALGFDVRSRVELLRQPDERWRAGERIADRDFRV